MCLHVHSDASYNSEPKACSRVCGHHFLSRHSLDPTWPPPSNAGAIHTISSILKNIMASVFEEAEMGGLLLNGTAAVILQTITIEELGHP